MSKAKRLWSYRQTVTTVLWDSVINICCIFNNFVTVYSFSFIYTFITLKLYRNILMFKLLNSNGFHLNYELILYYSLLKIRLQKLATTCLVWTLNCIKFNKNRTCIEEAYVQLYPKAWQPYLRYREYHKIQRIPYTISTLRYLHHTS